MSTTYLITGGAGFIGSHFCKLALKENWCSRLTNLDGLTYAGNLKNLEELTNDSRYSFVCRNLLEDSVGLGRLLEETKPEVLVHFAAESHVDRSIEDPSAFLKTNILGTFNLLENLRRISSPWVKRVRFLYVSTDEVYGSLGESGYFYESTPLSPRSPYAASKAAADMLTQAYFHTYQMNTVTVRCSNNYGPNQFPEKLIPQTIIFGIQNRAIPIYGKGENVRDWIFVEDFVRGIQAAITKGKTGHSYNFGGKGERKNIEVVRTILKCLQKPEDLIQFVEDRKGHDFRYAMDFEKASKELGWTPQVPLDQGLRFTVKWYQENQTWWKEILSGEYKQFFDRYYGARLSRA